MVKPEAPPNILLLACAVFEQEIALLTREARHIRETRWFEMGLHDCPDRLRRKLQAEIAAVGDRQDIEAVVLAYGLCGRGTAGLQARGRKLVIPRAHDCITLFLGSKERYAQHHRACPASYYYTPGWNRARRVPGPDRLTALQTELAQRFDPEEVAFLIAAEREQWSQPSTAFYLDLGTPNAELEADYARRCADWLGWKYERRRGDATLLHDLLWGNWDAERFQIVEPGLRLEQAMDDSILRVAPAPHPDASA
jgi:hypothetical protein